MVRLNRIVYILTANNYETTKINKYLYNVSILDIKIFQGEKS